MPISWITVLQAVPWTEVIKAAPQIAEGAKKLWNTVSRKGPPVVPVPLPDPNRPLDPEELISTLQTRVSLLETSLAELEEQMLASSELIKALAEQNAELVRGVELNRQHLRRITRIAALAGAAALGGLAYWLWRA